MTYEFSNLHQTIVGMMEAQITKAAKGGKTIRTVRAKQIVGMAIAEAIALGEVRARTRSQRELACIVAGQLAGVVNKEGLKVTPDNIGEQAAAIAAAINQRCEGKPW